MVDYVSPINPRPLPTVTLSGVASTGAEVTLLAIPDLSFAVGGTRDMGQYINDPGGLRTNTAVLGLTTFATYDSGTELLTGISAGTETGLQLEVTY